MSSEEALARLDHRRDCRVAEAEFRILRRYHKLQGLVFRSHVPQRQREPYDENKR